MIAFTKGESTLPLSVIKFNNIKENTLLRFDLSSNPRWQVVCPNPAVADAFRNNLEEREGSESIETTTIAKFLSDLFKDCFPERSVSRKSELLKILGTVWKLKFEGEDSAFFHQSFELFTDLRSFTLDKSLMDQVLESYHPIVSESVKTFWLVLENQSITDEHLAYYDLYNYCRDNPEVLGDEEIPGYVFTGFSHLSANQIEFIKLLGKFTNVLVPIPQDVMNEAMPTDWVDWIKTQADDISEIPSEEDMGTIETYHFSKGRSNSLLKRIFEKVPGDIILPKKTLSFADVLQCHHKDLFFKNSNDDFETSIKILKEEIAHQFLLSEDDKVGLSELKNFLIEKVRDKKFSSFKDFAHYKLITTFLETLSDYEELSDANSNLKSYDMTILWEVIKLNLPRNFNLPLLKKVSNYILSLKDLYQVDDGKINYILVDSNHDLSVGGTTGYPKEVQEILVTLGPIRRQGLDFAFYIHHLREILKSPNTKLLIEEGLLEHDQAWASIVGNEQLSRMQLEGTKAVPRVLEVLQDVGEYTPPKKLSASRMQTYLDCPGKYYYSYVLGLGNEPGKERNIDPRILGEIEHRVVQGFLDNYNDWDEVIFKEMVDKDILSSFDESILENQALREEIDAEVYFYSKQTIIEFLKLKGLDPEISFKFESGMDNDEGAGSADVVIESKVLGRMLFDLKRSGGSIPDKYKIMNQRYIQLWYYLYFLKGKESPFNCFGYINLSDGQTSVVFSNDVELKNKLASVDFLNLEKYEGFKGEFTDHLENFYDLYKNVKTGLIEKQDYSIMPIDSSSCNFCKGAAICTRGQVQ